MRGSEPGRRAPVAIGASRVPGRWAWVFDKKMKPLLKGQDCIDHDPIESWRPEDPAVVDYWLCLHIGPAEGQGADLFYVNVLSELAASTLPEEELARRKKIVVPQYSWPAVMSAVDQILRASEGPDWAMIAEKLMRKFDWEFENYREFENYQPLVRMNERPLSVAVISCLSMTAGVVGIAYHATEFKAERPFEYELVWVCFVRLLAILCGVFMLRGRNWARWLLLVWIAYHVVLSAFHSLSELVMHGLLFAVVAWFLFRPRASAYFRGTRAEPAQIPKTDDTPVAS